MDQLVVQPPLSLNEDVVVAELAERTRCTVNTVIVEIGGNAGRGWAERLRVGAWHSVDPRNTDTTSGRFTAWKGRGEAMPLSDGTADVVFSCNAFQFVDVAGVLNDAHRILRPGGVLYAHFGPIWSGPDGHQLEYVRYRGKELKFWTDTLLPPYAHLRFSSSELQSILASALPAALVDLLVTHVYTSTTINRLFAEDYLDLFRASPFALREYAASEQLDYPIETPSYDHELLTGGFDLAALGARTACLKHDHHHLGFRDIRILLQKV